MNSRIPEDTTRERPRERLLMHGSDALSADELIAIILGTGVRGVSAVTLAQRLTNHTGGLARLARAPARELCGVGGIGPARAARIAAAFQLGRRGAQADAPFFVTTADDVFRRLAPRMCGLTQEVFVVVALDVRNAVVCEVEVARGCLTGVEVHPREVFRPMIRCGAAACIVAHNHPSGDHEPSPEDLLLTRRLQEVGDLVGIPVLDHLVVGNATFTSIAAHLRAY